MTRLARLITHLRAWITEWWDRQDDYWENPR